MNGCVRGTKWVLIMNLRMTALVVAVVLGSIPLGPSKAFDAPPGTESELVAETSSNWWSAVQGDIRASEYLVSWQEKTYLHDVAAAYQAPNRAQNLRTYFKPEGLAVIPRARNDDEEAGADPQWRWQLSLVSWGRDLDVQMAGQATIDVQADRIAYKHRGLVEVYRNAEDGIHQIIDINRPANQNDSNAQSELVVAFAVGGDLTPPLTGGGSSVEFAVAAGEVVLRYGAVSARDAADRQLPVRLEHKNVDGTRQGNLLVMIDDTGATYPLQIKATITGLSGSPDWEAGGGQEDANLGYAVATAGDVNCDGYSDVIVGAPDYDHGQIDEGRAYVYHGSAPGLGVSPAWVKESDQTRAHYGWSVATAGDVNGDLCSDVIIGAPLFDNGENNEGAAWVYHGAPTGLESEPANIYEGNQASASFGYVVATAGDVNGDQYSDIIVGAPDCYSGHLGEGCVWVWHGSADGVGENHNWRAESNQEYANLGTSAATAGDVNGDGYADIIVGATGYYHGQPREGVALVWHGSANGVNNDVNGFPDNAEWMGESNQMDANLGRSVSTAGDVNGDGFADVIVGANKYHNGQDDEGGAWVFLGSSSGLSDTSDNHDEGNQAGAMFGFSVATAGDVNGDGYADVIVGAPYFSNGEFREGRVWVWHGSADGISETRDWQYEVDEEEARLGFSVATAGDVNGDGYSDIIVGACQKNVSVNDEGAALVFHGSAATLAEEPGWTKASNKYNASFGWSVRTAGDVNGDGYADIVVGAPGWDGGQQQEGGAWVYHGSATGPISAPAWHAEGNQEDAHYGHSVDTAGDVNGDGYSDVVVGAPDIDNGNSAEGLAFVYHGSVAGLDTSEAWSAESDWDDARFGFAVGTAGDVNGDGYGDVIVGAPWYSDGEIEEGFAWVYHGSRLGLGMGPIWYYPGPDADANAGTAVGTAGDVNGDGYSDVIVGAPNWSNGQAKEGGAFVFHGSSSGLFTSPDWAKDSARDHARYGQSVGTAGDVNGDGYADIIVGAPEWTGAMNAEGGAWVYHGSASGVHSAPDWDTFGGQEAAGYGHSVGTAGDVNGDGYADVVVGAPRYQRVLAFEGQIFMYYGNGGPGIPLNPRQIRPASPVPLPIAHLGRSPAEDRFWLTMYVRTSPYGRGRVMPEFEVSPLGVSLDGANIRQSGIWYSPSATGITLLPPMAMTALSPGTVYHWRARLRYRPSSVPFQPFSRWVTVPWNGWNEGDLRTGSAEPLSPPLFLPLVVQGLA